MIHKGEEPTAFGDVLTDIGPELRPHDCGRFDVRRTRHTEDRQPIPRWLRLKVYKRDHFRCVWCGSSDRLELDHIVPWSAGGPDTIDNLRTLCKPCNSYRSNRGYSLDLSARGISHGRECVNCNPERVLGHPQAEGIFCTRCEVTAVGLSHRPLETAYFRGYVTLDEAKEAMWDRWREEDELEGGAG